MTENLLVSLNDIEEKEASWLVPQRMPKGQIKLKKAILEQNSKAINYEQSKPVFSIRRRKEISMISTNDFVLRSELMKEVARLSDLCEQLHLKSFTIKFDRDAGADAWANG